MSGLTGSGTPLLPAKIGTNTRRLEPRCGACIAALSAGNLAALWIKTALPLLSIDRPRSVDRSDQGDFVTPHNFGMYTLLASAALSACNGNTSIPAVQSPSEVTSAPPVAEPEITLPDQSEPNAAQAVSIARCDSASETLQTAMLEAINRSRAMPQICGSSPQSAAPALQWDSRLAAAANQHSTDMAVTGFFSHSGSDGLDVGARATAAGFEWRAIGENIAAGQQTISDVHSGWMASPGHCANIMGDQYTHVGASCIVQPGSRYGSYWTVVFGQPLR